MKMKKVYLVSVFASRDGRKLEEFFIACRATGYRAAQNAATREFTRKGYDVNVSCIERDETWENNPLTAVDTAELEGLKDDIRNRIAKYNARIAETNALSDDEVAKLGWCGCAHRLLDCIALKNAQKKLAALDAFKFPRRYQRH